MDSTSRTVVKVNSPADILGVLPHRIGFHPTESLVAVSLRGPRRRDELVMRLDLPRAGQDAAAASEVVARLSRHGADGAVLVVYTEGPGPAAGLARAPLVRSLRRSMHAAGIEVVDALLVRGGRWWSFVCRDESCCPAEGVPLPAVLTPAATQYAAESVGRGAVVLVDRSELERSVEARPDAEACFAVGHDLFALLAREPDADIDRLVSSTVDDLARRWSQGECVVDPGDVSVVALGLRVSAVRDRVMTMVLDHDPALLVALFAEVARQTPDPVAAPVCAVLAWSAYAAGDGALASVAAERARRVQPGYQMAELILSGLDAMQPPDTIRQISALVRADLDLADLDLADLDLDEGDDEDEWDEFDDDDLGGACDQCGLDDAS